jgi:hypothetical protein
MYILITCTFREKENFESQNKIWNGKRHCCLPKEVQQEQMYNFYVYGEF